jgi:RNA polymerase sigma-70 factor (ECF subfamily)
VDKTTKARQVCEKEDVETWIQAARRGSSSALGDLIDACRPYLLSIARGALPAGIRAKVGPSDLVQDTALEAHRDFASFKGDQLEELLAWLRRILLNNVANTVRGFERTGKRNIAREGALEPNERSVTEIRSAASSPSSRVALLEESQRVNECLARLPADMRTAILLRHREYLSFVEIGIHTKRSPAAARKLWARAIELLQDELLKTDERD